MRMTRDQWEELVAHARQAAPSECCGFLKLRGGRVEQVVRAERSQTWAYGFKFEMPDLLALTEAEDEGYEVAIYHSHPRSAAEPSQQDMNDWGWPYPCVIVSLRDDPAVRVWTIADGRVEERDLELAG